MSDDAGPGGGPENAPSAGARARLQDVAWELSPASMRALLDAEATRLLARAFADAHSHEGTCWWVDEPSRSLVPIWNSGPSAAEFVSRFAQPLSTGLIGMVFASEQPFVENAVPHSTLQDRRLDRQLGVRTLALIAVPLIVFHRCHGVVSCVQLDRGDAAAAAPVHFTGEDLHRVTRAVTGLTRLLEQRITHHVLGTE